MAQKFEKEGVVILAVNAWNEDTRDLRRFAAEKGLQQRILLNGQGVRRLYQVPSIPTTVWIDRQGRIVDAEVGFHGRASLERKTKAVLAQG